MNFNQFKRFIPHLLIFGFFSAVIFSSLLFTPGGLLHHESQWLLPNYYSDRSASYLIFDVAKNDGGYYQSRELSYLFDYIDAQFIKISAVSGFFHLYSLTYFISIAVILILAYYLSSKFFRPFSPTLFTLACSLFLTSPVIYFSNFYFRSAKILTALFLVFCLTFFLQYLKKQKKIYLILLFTAAFLMSLSDRQGYFALLSFFAISAACLLLMRKRKYLFLCLAFFATILISNFYTYFLAPQIIFQKTGLKVNLRHLRMDFDSYLDLTYESIGYKNPNTLANHLSRLPNNIKKGGILLADSIAYMLGNNPPYLIIIVFLLFHIYLLKKNPKTGLILTAGSFFAWTMTVMLVIKHPPAVWDDLRRHYYMIAPTVLYFIFILFLLSLLIKKFPNSKTVITIVLSILLGFNILFLPIHLKYIRDFSSSPAFKYAPFLIQCVRKNNISADKFGLSKEAESMCRQLRNNFYR